MRRTLAAPLLILMGLVLVFASTVSLEAATGRARQNAGNDVTYSLNRAPENSKKYDLIISYGDEQSISGSFSIDQLQILRAVMSEAGRFAFTGEGVGAKEPVTTRFADKQEIAFIVDAEKSANQTNLYLTLTTEIGRTTILMGKVIRSTRREEGVFFDLLSRLESILPKTPARPSK